MENLGRRIRAFRKLKGFTQQELAEGVGVSIDILGPIERGNRLPEQELLEKISLFLDIDLRELVKQYG